MQLHPSLVLVFASVLGLAVAFSLMMVGAVWARVQSFPPEEATRRVDDLSRRQDTLEAILERLELGRGSEEARPAGGPGEKAGSSGTTGGDSRAGGGPRTDRGEASAVGGPTLIAIPSLTGMPPEASAVAAAELGRRFGAIWALADAGQAPEAIARTTAQPIGQVELILGQRRQLLSSTGSRN
jgi:hypothetical protein